MPKNVLFLLKNRKNRRALGVPPQTPPIAAPSPMTNSCMVTRLNYIGMYQLEIAMYNILETKRKFINPTLSLLHFPILIKQN